MPLKLASPFAVTGAIGRSIACQAYLHMLRLVPTQVSDSILHRQKILRTQQQKKHYDEPILQLPYANHGGAAMWTAQ